VAISDIVEIRSSELALERGDRKTLPDLKHHLDMAKKLAGD
jgi:hypothetical protein